MKEINIDIVHDELFKEKPLLAFSKENDYLSWKQQIKDKYIELLGLDVISQSDCPLNIEIEEVVEKEEYTRIRYTFFSEHNCQVPAYLLVPKNVKKEKYPVCICLQGHTTGFHISIGEGKYDGDEEYLETSTFAIDAVERGYVALAIEQRGMGERTTPRPDRSRSLTCGCYHTAMTALLLGRTLIGERVWDVHKGIDSLSHFKDKYSLDLEDISLVGNSGGGTATYYSACFDERIKVAAPTCAVCAFEDSIAYTTHCSCNYIPRLARYMDMGELATLIVPRKLIVSVGEKDPIFLLPGSKKVFDVIQQIYTVEQVPQYTRFVVFKDREHYFDREQVFNSIEEMRNIK